MPVELHGWGVGPWGTLREGGRERGREGGREGGREMHHGIEGPAMGEGDNLSN